MQVLDSRLTLLYVYLILYIITIKEKKRLLFLEVKVRCSLFVFLNRMTVSIFMVYFNSLFNFTLIHCSVIIADSLLSDGNHVTVLLGWTRRTDGGVLASADGGCQAGSTSGPVTACVDLKCIACALTLSTF